MQEVKCELWQHHIYMWVFQFVLYHENDVQEGRKNKKDKIHQIAHCETLCETRKMIGDW